MTLIGVVRGQRVNKIHEHFMRNLQSVVFLCLINQDAILTYCKRRYSYTRTASRQYTILGGQLRDLATLHLRDTHRHTLTPGSLLSSHVRLDLLDDLLPLGSFTRTLYASIFSHSCHILCPPPSSFIRQLNLYAPLILYIGQTYR